MDNISKVKTTYLLLLFLPFFAFAQKATFQFYTTEDGLSHNGVMGIAQDQQGFIWVGADALNRFDGSQFLNYNNSDYPVFTNRRDFGNIVTDGVHLYYYDNHQIIVVNTVTGEERGIKLDAYFSDTKKSRFGTCEKLPNGEIVVVILDTETEQVYLVRLHKGRINRVDILPDIIVSFTTIFVTLCGDGQGNVYYPDKRRNAIVKISPEGEVLQIFPFELKGGMVHLAAGRNNSVFVVSSDKIFALEEGSNKFRLHPISLHTSGRSISDVLETEDGSLWVSGFDRWLLFYQTTLDKAAGFRQELESVIPNQVNLRNLFMDSKEDIWVGTAIGLLKVTPRSVLFDSYFTAQNEYCGGHCSFRGLAEDGKGQVFASFYNNIFQINQQGIADQVPLISAPYTPFDLLFDAGEIILNNGYVLKPETDVMTNPYGSLETNYDIGLLSRDGKGRIWWAWGSRFFVLDKKQASPKWKEWTDRSMSSFFTDLKYDPFHKWMWFSNASSLMAYDTEAHQFQYFYKNEDGSNVDIHFIYPDGKGTVWMGTEHGLLHFDPATKEHKKYTQTDGLPNEFVHGIQPEGDSCLWLATNNGLSRFSIATGQFINFFEEDGLAGNEFNRHSSFKASDGRMYFGGTKGITAFFPKEVMDKRVQKQETGKLRLYSFSMTDDDLDTVLTDVFHPDKPSMDVYYQNKSIVLEFGLMDFRKKGKTQYSYQLDGYDNTWSKPSKNNTVTFSSLPSGKYVFRVKALSAQGQWLPGELAVRMTVHPPWWASWWAWCLYALAFAGLAFGIFSFLKKRWALQNQLLLGQQEATRLKELDHFKSRLYTNLTHEFRTPLTVILGMADEGKLEMEKWRHTTHHPFPISSKGVPTDDFLISTFNLIERSGQNLLRLVNQLLDLSKLEDRSFKLHLQQADIIPFLRYVTESFRPLASSRKLSLNFICDLEKMEMDFDAEQVQQVLGNLLSNALKFTPEGGEVKVLVGSTNFQKLSNLQVSISDTGIGIAEKDLPHIFDRFYQADNSAARAGEGTGIGLAHAMELMKLMGGDILVDSELGKGTCFTMSLPVSKEAAEMPLPEAAKIEKGAVANGSVKELTPFAMPTFPARKDVSPLPQLLIVEDNADVVIYLKTCLEGLFEISVATDGKVGIEKAFEYIPDLILSDVMMPEKNGYELCDELKNDQRTSHIPIVLLTAKVDRTSKITGLRRGADAYLSKPFDKQELLATLEMMLVNKRRMLAYFSQQKLQGTLPRSEIQNGDLATAVETAVGAAIEVENAFLLKVRQIVEEHHSDPHFALPQLCEKIGMSRYQLFRKMKAVAGESPSRFIRSFRMEKAKILLGNKELNVSEVAWQVGFKDLPHFSKTFQEAFGQAPSEFRK